MFAITNELRAVKIAVRHQSVTSDYGCPVTPLDQIRHYIAAVRKGVRGKPYFPGAKDFLQKVSPGL